MCLKVLPTSSVADPDPGSGAFVTPWIRDPGWVKNQIRIRDEHPRSYFPQRLENFFVKILNSMMWDPESFLSGMEKIRSRDKHPGSATKPTRNKINFCKTYWLTSLLSKG
jgi:hypothetical protein